MGLPGMNGYDMCRRLRSDPLLKAVPIVAATGWCTPQHMQKAVDAGCDVVLCKPCPPDEIVAAIRRLLATA